ncbi:MAG: response regulator [Bacteroidetes bacterium]|nr:response regulator [Bacteroidota bacterium]
METTKYKILLVENDEDERDFMKEGFCQSRHFDVLDIFSNGDELIEYLNEKKSGLPDIILSDLNMPGKNGYDILLFMKKHDALSGIPVIITSTSSSASTIRKCEELGAADFLVKPDTFDQYRQYSEKLYGLIQEKKLV